MINLRWAILFVITAFLTGCESLEGGQFTPITNTVNNAPLTPGQPGFPTDPVDTQTPDAKACKPITIANPAAVYCGKMGYSPQTIETDQGQAGECVFPDGSSCDAWEFLRGQCGQQYSYCVKNGYGIKTLHDGQDPFSQEYAACTDAEGNIVGSVTELSQLQCAGD